MNKLTDYEIKDQLKHFEEDIYRCSSAKYARDLKHKIDAFCEVHKPTQEQIQAFEDEGAYEMLCMMASIPDND